VDDAPAHLGQKIEPSTARVTIDGIPLPVAPGLVYYLVYKPPGVVTTAEDPQGRSTVMDLVPPDPRVHPVGRLDADSEGLLLLTNDGDLTYHITHPRFGVDKTYVVLVSGVIRDGDLRRLVAGIDLDDGPAAAVGARVLDRRSDESLVEVTMNEGRKREVRRMMAAIGHPVIRLVRTGIGPLREAKLQPGERRTLSVTEVRALYAAGGETSSGE
jgi:23S rRNA pseudouridine2605 synthase